MTSAGFWKDFFDVFSRQPGVVVQRLPQVAAVWRAVMLGHEQAAARLVRLQVEVTDRCNFDCLMCNRATRNLDYPLTNDLDSAALMRLIDEVHPLYVTLNGLGEPLLHPQIDRIIQGCRQRHITTSMPTNLSLTRALLEKIAVNPPDILQLSIHGATKAVFEGISRGSDFERCLDNARRFLAASDRSKIRVRVLCALQARNLLEHRSMFHLLRDLDLLADFRLTPVYDYTPQLSDERRVIPTEAEMQAAREQIEADTRAAQVPQEQAFYRIWLQALDGIKPNDGRKLESGPCLIPWFSSYITARGEVLPCCYLTGEQAVMGNILHRGSDLGQGFAEIWNGEAYRAFRRRLRQERADLPGCNYCPRDDTARLMRYGAWLTPGSMWKR